MGTSKGRPVMARKVALTRGEKSTKDALPSEQTSKIKMIFLDFRFEVNPSTGDSRFIYASTLARFMSAIAKIAGANALRAGIYRARERTMDLVLGGVPKGYRRACGQSSRHRIGTPPRSARCLNKFLGSIAAGGAGFPRGRIRRR